MAGAVLPVVSRTCHVTVSSSTASSTPVTVTVCAVFQFVVLNVRLPGATEPSLVSRLATATATAAEGAAASVTGKVAVPPSSVTCPLTVPNNNVDFTIVTVKVSRTVLPSRICT